MLDKLKLVAAIVLVTAGMVGFYYFQNSNLLLRVVGLLAMALVAVGVVYTTAMGKATWVFMGETRQEVRKIVWPTSRETTQMTLVVMVMVLIVAIFLWLLDMLLGAGVKMFIGQGS